MRYWAIAVWLAATVSAAERVVIPKIDQKPEIDGKPSDECWSQATVLWPFREVTGWTRPTPVPAESVDSISFGWDDLRLYVLAATDSGAHASLLPRSDVFRVCFPKAVLELGLDGSLVVFGSSGRERIESFAVLSEEGRQFLEAEVPFRVLDVNPVLSQPIKVKVERIREDRPLSYSDELELVPGGSETPGIRLLSLGTGKGDRGVLSCEVANPSEKEVGLKLQVQLPTGIFSEAPTLKPGQRQTIRINYGAPKAVLLTFSAVVGQDVVFQSPPYALLEKEIRAAGEGPLNLIPEPAELRVLDGFFEGKLETVWFEEGIAPPACLRELGLRTVPKPPASLLLLTPKSPNLPKEVPDLSQLRSDGYSLLVTKESVVLVATRPQGFAWGVRTLSQLLAAGRLPCLTMVDGASVPLRGLCVRFALKSYSALFRTMSRYKLNVLVHGGAACGMTAKEAARIRTEAGEFGIAAVPYLSLYGLGMLLPEENREAAEPLVPCPFSERVRERLAAVLHEQSFGSTRVLIDTWLPEYRPDPRCREGVVRRFGETARPDTKCCVAAALLGELAAAAGDAHIELLLSGVEPETLLLLDEKQLRRTTLLSEASQPYPVGHLSWLAAQKALPVGALLVEKPTASVLRPAGNLSPPLRCSPLSHIHSATCSFLKANPVALLAEVYSTDSPETLEYVAASVGSCGWNPISMETFETRFARTAYANEQAAVALRALRLLQTNGVLLSPASLLQLAATSLNDVPPETGKRAQSMLKTIVEQERLAGEAFAAELPAPLKAALAEYTLQSQELFRLKKAMEDFKNLRELYETVNAAAMPAPAAPAVEAAAQQAFAALKQQMAKHLEQDPSCPFRFVHDALQRDALSPKSMPLALAVFGVPLPESVPEANERLRNLLKGEKSAYALLRLGEVYQFTIHAPDQALDQYGEAFRTAELTEGQVRFLHRALAELAGKKVALHEGATEGLPELFWFGDFLVWLPQAKPVSLECSLDPRLTLTFKSKTAAKGILWLPADPARPFAAPDYALIRTGEPFVSPR